MSSVITCLAEPTLPNVSRALDLALTLDEREAGASPTTVGSLMHAVVNAAPEVHRRTGSCSTLVPLVYRLALRGASVNVQDAAGNTPLHLAAVRPRADGLAEHLLRCGADPETSNRNDCSVLYSHAGHMTRYVKGQKHVGCGLWAAVARENTTYAETLLRSWFRVRIRGRDDRSLRELADETGCLRMQHVLERYDRLNEIAIAALACDERALRAALERGDPRQLPDDHARPVPVPLSAVLREFGTVSEGARNILRQHGVDDGDYHDRVLFFRRAFHESPFFSFLREASVDSLLRALDSVGELDLSLRSFRDETYGYTWLHQLVDVVGLLPTSVVAEERNVCIRILYRLALAGIDVNVRDRRGRTALVVAAESDDQELMTHLLRVGCDSSISDSKGNTVYEEMYAYRGRLKLGRCSRSAALPGLWPALMQNDERRLLRWLNSWSRVSIRRGDRNLLDVARSLGRSPRTIEALERARHRHEFVCAALACDRENMMELISLGGGVSKVNICDELWRIGVSDNRMVQFMARPVLVAAMEITDQHVLGFLVQFGADLAVQYEESYPCGPVAFWAFRDSVDNRNTLVVAKHAAPNVRDEHGCTMLHRIVQKQQTRHKLEIIQTLLDRGCDVSARDWDGCTARDYVMTENASRGDEIREAIDNHVLDLVNNDRVYEVETLLLNSYDGVTNIRGTQRNKTALEMAQIREYKEMTSLLQEADAYTRQVRVLLESCCTGDLSTLAKLAGEKRCASGRHPSGRSLLHQAVLHQRVDVATFLIEHFPALVNSQDNRGRTPLHYCVCLAERKRIWSLLQDAGADPNLADHNNMSVYDYVRELEAPTPLADRPKGRRTRNYRPSEIVSEERSRDYGRRVAAHRLFAEALRRLDGDDGDDHVSAELDGERARQLQVDGLDRKLLKACLERGAIGGAISLLRHGTNPIGLEVTTFERPCKEVNDDDDDDDKVEVEEAEAPPDEAADPDESPVNSTEEQPPKATSVTVEEFARKFDHAELWKVLEEKNLLTLSTH